jgi:hypothetical protein
MCQVRRQRFAPSAAAASYSAGSMEAIAARNTMIPQPASFQSACAVTRYLKVLGSVMMSHGFIPCVSSRWLSSPAPPSICWNSTITSTHEKKCGRYTIAWMNERILLLSTEFSSNASAIGTGKYSTSCTKLSTSVFSNACQKFGSANSSWKFCSPIQVLCQNPRM